MFAALPDFNALLVELAIMPVLYVGTLALGRWLKRSAGVQLGVLYQLFCVLFSIWLPLEILGTEFPNREPLIQLGRAANILLGTVFVLALIRRYFWERWYETHRQEKAPKFLSQITGLVAVIVAILFIFGGVYGHSIEGVVFGSTVVVGIVGFAMQDLLGNIIAGIALEIGKPFKPGDWLKVEGQHAEVMEVNWRSTRLRTNDDIYLDIPNKTIVGATITNLTYPTRQHAIRLQVGFEYSTPPNLIKDMLGRAAAEVPGVLPTPPPKVFLWDFADSAVLYEIKFWLDDETRYNDILDGIRTNIWYTAQRQGISIPFPIRTVRMERPGARKQDALGAARAKVRQQPFLQLLGEEQVDKLLTFARLQRFGRGEKVIEQGAAGESMFILLSGEADVLVDVGGQPARVATLHTGDYCGEMSLLTGEPRSATVVAHTDCEMWEIDKSVVAELLQENETLVQQLGEMLAHRRLETEGILASNAGAEQVMTKQKEYTAGFLQKLYSFFEL
jgi:small-conductance mechanosensitive channel/CRP-like cAMP-binding protein